MNQHIKRVHDEEKSCICQECHLKLFSQSHLRLHFESAHEIIKKLECQICKRSYSSRGNLFKHRKVIHGNFEPVKLMHSSLKTDELRTEQLL